MSQASAKQYPRRILLNQSQLAQLLAERRALNEWHAIRLFVRSLYGEGPSSAHSEGGSEHKWMVGEFYLEDVPLKVHMQTPFWRAVTNYSAIYAPQPAPEMVQNIVDMWSVTLPTNHIEWSIHDLPNLIYTGPLAIPPALEPENAYANDVGISFGVYQRAVERFTAFFPKARIEPGLHNIIGHFHWQYRIGQLSIEAVADRLSVFVFDLVQLWMQHDLEVYSEGAEGDYLISPEKLAALLKQEIALYAHNPEDVDYDASMKSYQIWITPVNAPELRRVYMRAHIKNNRIIIDEDPTDKLLFEALLYVGVPREQMIFAYKGNVRPLTYNIDESS